MAEFHGISPAVYLYLKGIGNGSPVEDSELASSYHSAVRRHLFAVRDLPFLSRAFASFSGPWLVIKGPVLSEVIYERPDLRSYTDLDVIVPGPCLGHALRLLEGAGARIIDDDWQLLMAAMRGELRVLLPSGTLVDLHWHLLSHRRLREDFSISMEQLFDRRRLVGLGGQRVATLDAVDTIVHLAVHACLAGGNRLLWIKDMEQCIVNQRFSWDDVVDRAHQWSAGLLVATHLARTMRIFQFDVPKNMMEELTRSRSWPLLIAGLDRFAPVERATGSRSASRIVSRATRGDGVSSFLELRRRMTAWVAGGAPTGPPVAPSQSSGAHIRASQSEKGGRSSREAFLEAVAQDESPPEVQV